MSSTVYPSLVNLSLNYTSSAIIVRFIYSYLGFFISLEGELVFAKTLAKIQLFACLSLCVCVYCLHSFACASGDRTRVSKAFFACKDIVDLI